MRDNGVYDRRVFGYRVLVHFISQSIALSVIIDVCTEDGVTSSKSKNACYEDLFKVVLRGTKSLGSA